MDLNYQLLNLYNHNIYVAFNEHEVHVKNNKVFNDLLKNHILICRDIANNLKLTYRKIIKKDLNISADSIALEILGHVYPNRIASVIFKILPALNSIPGFVLDKTDTIDIGEIGYDSNRWVWDRLEPLYSAIIENLH